MKRYIKHIFLVWRRQPGDRRIKVGILRRSSTQGVIFRYILEGVNEAIKYGFSGFPDFPDIQATYINNVLERFSLRLNDPEREDIDKYYKYWEIEPSHISDRYYVLAQTQGLLPTDNFEFLAEYNPIKDLKFITEICGLSHIELKKDTIKEGDELSWTFEKNKYDKFAVALYKGKQKLGYVKIVHNKLFYESKYRKFKIVVKSVEQNGKISRAFISVQTLP